jgi:hypothetical protein
MYIQLQLRRREVVTRGEGSRPAVVAELSTEATNRADERERLAGSRGEGWGRHATAANERERGMADG